MNYEADVGEGSGLQLLHQSSASPVRAGAAAIVGLVAGLLLVGATFGDPRDESEGSAQPAQAVDHDEPVDDESLAALDEPNEPNDETVEDGPNGDGADDLVMVEDDAVEGDPVEGPNDDSAEMDLAAAAISGSESGPATEPSTPTPGEALPGGPGDIGFTRGRLAYLQCGDLADASGRCPRDRDLEGEAWRVLEAATTHCGLPAGTGDARFHFSGAGAELRVRDFGDRPLNDAALTRCVEPYAGALRTTLSGGFILSVRFELR